MIDAPHIDHVRAKNEVVETKAITTQKTQIIANAVTVDLSIFFLETTSWAEEGWLV
jgi:hypothetical protein